MRLKNKGIFYAGHNYRVVLDTNKVSTNYIERTKGTIFDEKESKHLCSRCLKEVTWMDWKYDETFAMSTCDCGKKATILILPFKKTANI